MLGLGPNYRLWFHSTPGRLNWLSVFISFYFTGVNLKPVNSSNGFQMAQTAGCVCVCVCVCGWAPCLCEWAWVEECQSQEVKGDVLVWTELDWGQTERHYSHSASDKDSVHIKTLFITSVWMRIYFSLSNFTFVTGSHWLQGLWGNFNTIYCESVISEQPNGVPVSFRELFPSFKA